MSTAVVAARGRVSEFYRRRDEDQFFADVEPIRGELLEFKRKGYRHWAVYIGYYDLHGNGGLVRCVIHAANPAVSPGVIAATLASTSHSLQMLDGSKGKIIIEALSSVWMQDECKLNNHMDNFWTPFAPPTVVRRAFAAMCFDASDYHVLTNNCEHFCNWCRYNKKQSSQVNRGVVAVTVATVGAVAAFGIPGLIMAGTTALVGSRMARSLQGSTRALTQ